VDAIAESLDAGMGLAYCLMAQEYQH
jgi:hypothetical protein